MYQAVTIAPDPRGSEVHMRDAQVVSFPSRFAPLLGLAEGTPLQTTRGTVRVQDLQAGDQLLCEDGSSVVLRNMASTHFSQCALLLNRAFAPIRFDHGTFADQGGLPTVLMSPDMPVHVDLDADITIPAHHLEDGAAVRSVVPDEGVTYITLTLDRAATLVVNGLRLCFGTEANTSSLGQFALPHGQEEQRVFRPLR